VTPEARRNKGGRPVGSQNRYTGALKELFLQAAEEVGDRLEIGPNGELDGIAFSRAFPGCGPCGIGFPSHYDGF
jgi:hypothetical protein